MRRVYASIPYEGSPLNRLRLDDATPDARSKHLFGKYVRQQNQKHQDEFSTNDYQNLSQYLIWLAQQMNTHNITMFYIEHLQPWMLPKRIEPRYRWGMGLGVGLFGLVMLLSFQTANVLLDVRRFRLADAVWVMILGGLIIYMLAKEMMKDVAVADRLHWNIITWQPLRIVLRWLLNWGQILVLIWMVIFWVIVALIWWMNISLNTQLSGALKSQRISEHMTWTIIILISVLILWLILVWIQGAPIQHFVLRILFTRGGAMPWDYAKFLQACAKAGLLRQVGGGFIFRHRYLQDFFAREQGSSSLYRR
jgi:hypothetical protein